MRDLVTLGFLIPASYFVQFSFGGELFGSDVVAAVGAVYIFAFRQNALAKAFAFDKFRWVLLGFGLYLIGLIAADAINQTEPDKYMRGWARLISAFLIFFDLFVCFVATEKAVIWSAAGLIIGLLLELYVHPNLFFAGGEIWKFGYSTPIIIFCVLVLSLMRSTPFRLIAVLGSISVVNLYLDYRSMFGIVAVTCTILLLSSKRDRHQITSARRFISLASIIGVSVLFVSIYTELASSGLLGLAAQDKYEEQATKSLGGGPLAILIGGRTDFIISAEAVFDSPIVGYGSWPENVYYRDRLATLQYELGESNGVELAESIGIPLHSHFLGSWIEAGFLGGLFWVLVMTLMLKGVMAALDPSEVMWHPLAVYMIILLFWDIFFSPFLGNHRLVSMIAFAIGLAFLYYQKSMSKPLSKKLI